MEHVRHEYTKDGRQELWSAWGDFMPKTFDSYEAAVAHVNAVRLLKQLHSL